MADLLMELSSRPPAKLISIGNAHAPSQLHNQALTNLKQKTLATLNSQPQQPTREQQFRQYLDELVPTEHPMNFPDSNQGDGFALFQQDQMERREPFRRLMTLKQ